MKHYIVNILVAAALTLCSLASCVKENISAPDHGEGTVYLSLNVLSGGMEQVIVKSPWDPNDDNERAVENLRIYIFSKATGNLVGYKYFSKDDLTFTDDSSQPGYDRTATVSNIPTSTGEVYIYAIANARTSQYKVTDDAILDIDESNLSHLTRETFLSATCTRQLGSINPADNRFVMSGFANNGEPVTIARKDGTTQQAEITSPTDDDHKRVKLYKILSKNKITVKTGNGVTFKPEYMEIHNVPQVYGLMRGNNVAPSGFETFDRIIWSENSYQCYLPANIQTTTKSPASFNDREKNTYDDTGKKTFDNAPANATYVVIHGKYQGGDYAGDLSYTVHLGDFTHNMSDFSVAANSNYEYTLTIKGVNNFIAESKKNGDDPGSEGVVIFKGTDILEVDCHYEARVMKFSMSELNKLINVEKYGYILKIQTAFCETISMIVDENGNIYDAAEFKTHHENPTVLTTVGTNGMPVDVSKILISGNEADFDWVRFVKNTGKYYSDYTPSQKPGSKVSSSHAISDVCAYPGRANTQTIFQFLRDLYKAGKEQTTSYFNATGSSVYVTCFVDENYYPKKNWTEYVNKSEPRRIYFANDLFVSADGQSSFARAKYVVSQKSIWTFYELDPTLNPFGLESVSEEKVQGVDVVKGTNSLEEPWDGRASAISNNKNKGFYASSTKSTGKQDIYTGAYKACMSRNRDENGNGTIDENEIKWYLASVDQYKGMWAGEEAFDTDARLFKATESEWLALKKAFGNGVDAKLSPWHYFTCSSANTFWAEEGCATGTNSSATMVRCIRTLVSNSDGLESAETYYSYKDNIVELKLNDVALRTHQSGGFQTYFERGKDSNKLYKKFKIASSNLPNKYPKEQVISSAKGSGFINSTDDVCQKAAGYGGSWRVPNQRELSIMSAVNKNLTDLYSCTSFTGVQSGYYKGGSGNEYGFVLSGTQMTVAVDKDYYVRCVMDVVD